MKQVCLLGVFAVGGFLPNFFSILPAPNLWLPIAFLVQIGFFCCRKRLPVHSLTPFVLSLLLGLSQGLLQSNYFAKRMLPKELDAQIFLLSGQVLDVKNRTDGSQKLAVKVSQLAFSSGEPITNYPRRVLLSWYQKEPFSLGEQFVAEVKLKRPRGLQNPGLFDYQKWLIAEGYGATGYIRSVSEIEPARQHKNHLSAALKRWRAAKLEWLQHRPDLRYANTHRALALGDGAALGSKTWTMLKNTGTVHLLVISGLHVGLIASFGYFLFFNLGRCISPFFDMNAVRLAIMGSLMLATVYALLSGFGLPAQRALIMLIALLVPRYFYLRVSPWWSFAVALALISVVDQRAVLSVGFWLSFGAVLLLFLGFQGINRTNFLLGLLRLQMLFFVGFSGVLLWQGAHFPTASLGANIFAVPFVSFVLVPAEFIALLMTVISEDLCIHFWKICDWLAGILFGFLGYVEGLDLPVLKRNSQWHLMHTLMAFIALALFAVPRRARLVPLAMIILVLVPKPENDYVLKMRVFDVGQGTSILIQQPGYSLVYDAGPRFSEDFNAGSGIIAPTLLQKGVPNIQKLIISHPDSDHRGGLEGLLSEISVDEMDVGKDLDGLEGWPDQRLCQSGERWRVDNVHYQYLWPTQKARAGGLSNNDSSCALMISFGEINILLPGDIGIASEYRLMNRYPELRDIDVLLVPHHGSKTSSSARFVRTLNPDMAIVSAGYKNQFRHPHNDVMSRYIRIDTEMLSTANSGAIELVWNLNDATPTVMLAAEAKKFWWQK